MLYEVAAPYSDTRASDLTLRLGLPPRPALGTLTVEGSGGALELRLLGHSHQVLTRVGPAELSEVVACEPGRGVLPATVRRTLRHADYRFESYAAALSPPALAVRAERLCADFSAHPAALVGVFPGLPHALTAVVADFSGGQLAWRSWHLYPQTAQVVMTRSSIRSR